MMNGRIPGANMETSIVAAESSSDGFSLVDGGKGSFEEERFVPSGVERSNRSMPGSDHGSVFSLGAQSQATNVLDARDRSSQEPLTPNEHRRVKRCRWIFQLGVVGMTGGVAVLLYKLLSRSEEDEEEEGDTEESGLTLPAVVALVVAAYGMLVLFAFQYYDCLVRKRHFALTKEAYRSRDIVASMFPEVVHERLFQTDGDKDQQQQEGLTRTSLLAGLAQIAAQAGVGGDFAMTNVDQEAAMDPGLSGSTQHSVGFSGVEAAQSRPQLRQLEDGGSKGMLPSVPPSSARNIMARGEIPMQRLRAFLSNDNMLAERQNNSSINTTEHDTSAANKDEPIADLFKDCTVLFADISGFTAWSSVREPAQVFKLLETIYRSFDRTARKRKVFKVETIGDCYVAVTGLPDPQPDHAVIMSKFAKECMQKMNELTKKLEATLGPNTSELCMRFGLHSGPVTAGVLRGEKSRFQLFGDTVNTASRMESTGQRNRIQGSQTTADLLVEAGKDNWIEAREDLVNAKGKGQIQTFWIYPKATPLGGLDAEVMPGSLRSVHRENSMVVLKSRPKGTSLSSSSHHKATARGTSLSSSSHHRGNANSSTLSSDGMNETGHSRQSHCSVVAANQQESQLWSRENSRELDNKSETVEETNRQDRLIDWNIQILTELLVQIVAKREAIHGKETSRQRRQRSSIVFESFEQQQALDEITEILPLTSPESIPQDTEIDMENVRLPMKAEQQLKDYVTNVACMYRDNYFHNFEHASHVLMASQKLLRRVIIADSLRFDESDSYTSLITDDPLICFAIVFCALIHDVDHTGVPNAQLISEKAHIASLYNNRSIAEQNSLDLAWDMLMDRQYIDLQRCIFTSQAELNRFRKLVVNVVLATDIFDPNMKTLRDSRWAKAFEASPGESILTKEDDMSLKATIVIEHIMQASDVAHTMQHWHIYQRWNERLFEEMYSSYQVNRCEKDPSIGWYQGELWFFDNYIIPLARKLKTCGVFGDASDECLKYALENRKEWEAKGEEIVRIFVAKHSL